MTAGGRGLRLRRSPATLFGKHRLTVWRPGPLAMAAEFFQ